MKGEMREGAKTTGYWPFYQLWPFIRRTGFWIRRACSSLKLITLIDALPRFFSSSRASTSLPPKIHPRVPGNYQFSCGNLSVGVCLLPWDQKSRDVGSVQVAPFVSLTMRAFQCVHLVLSVGARRHVGLPNGTSSGACRDFSDVGML